MVCESSTGHKAALLAFGTFAPRWQVGKDLLFWGDFALREERTHMALDLSDSGVVRHPGCRDLPGRRRAALRRGLRGALLSTLCMSFTLGPAVLRAQPVSTASAPTKEELAQAKLHFQAGVKAFQAGIYPVAATEFKEAYRLSKRPDLLFNLARVAETMGQPSQAVDYLEGYLRERPDAQDRGQVEKDIERLRGQIQSERPAPTPPPPVQQDTPPPAPVTTAPSLRERLPPLPALGLMGGGTVLLIIGFGLGGAALGVAKDVEAGKTYDAALDSKGRSLNAGAISMDVLGSVALAAGVGWTVWWALHRPAAGVKIEPPRLQPAVSAAPGVLSLGIGGRF